ncbi:hypothetical protein MHH28_06580 [Paenibacillus sp. FSL K6-1217]|uniref:hypothetical protein n=1 Tax=Paenibacillus sp. FSL K6-1217 TaxID=2921466 RepID=UPI003254A9AB
MKSKTKFRLSETQIAKLVEVNFGDEGKLSSIHELKGGMFNAAYLIQRTGDPYADFPPAISLLPASGE